MGTLDLLAAMALACVVTWCVNRMRPAMVMLCVVVIFWFVLGVWAFR